MISFDLLNVDFHGNYKQFSRLFHHAGHLHDLNVRKPISIIMRREQSPFIHKKA